MKLFGLENARVRRVALLALALAALALVIHQIFGEHGYLALRRKRQELQSLQLEIKKLQEENQRLEEEIKKLKTDPREIERLAREKMKLAKPGEIIYVLPEKKDKPPQTAGQAKENTK